MNIKNTILGWNLLWCSSLLQKSEVDEKPQKQNIKNNDINKKQHTEEPRVFLSSTF